MSVGYCEHHYQIGERSFSSLPEAMTYTCSLAEKGQLLRRLESAGLATHEELKNLSEIIDILESVGCIKCKKLKGQGYDDHSVHEHLGRI